MFEPLTTCTISLMAPGRPTNCCHCSSSQSPTCGSAIIHSGVGAPAAFTRKAQEIHIRNSATV